MPWRRPEPMDSRHVMVYERSLALKVVTEGAAGSRELVEQSVLG